MIHRFSKRTANSPTLMTCFTSLASTILLPVWPQRKQPSKRRLAFVDAAVVVVGDEDDEASLPACRVGALPAIR